MSTSLKDFLSMGIPALMRGAGRLHVFMASYNSIGSYQDGPVATGKDGLTIQVANGDLIFSPEAKLFPTDAALVAVVYAGLLAFGRATDVARRIKRDHPQSKVVITTCDCNLGRKMAVLGLMLESGEIEQVVVTDACGGEETMGEILHTFVREWPVAVTA